VSNHDFMVDDDLPPKIPPGEYAVQMKTFKTAMMFVKAPKLIIDFVIVAQCEHFELVLPKYYNVKRLIGHPQEGGRFKAGATGDFARDYFHLLKMGDRRLDRLPMSAMEGVTFLAKVSTVKRARDRDIPEALQYSKIDRLIKVLEGK